MLSCRVHASQVVEMRNFTDPPMCKVHFNGWSKSFDFIVSVDSDRLKPCSVELLAAGVKDAVVSHTRVADRVVFLVMPRYIIHVHT